MALTGENRGLSSWLAKKYILSLLFIDNCCHFFLKMNCYMQQLWEWREWRVGKGFVIWVKAKNRLFIIAEFVQEYLNAMLRHKSPLCEGACLNMFSLILIRLLCLQFRWAECFSQWQGYSFPILTVSTLFHKCCHMLKTVCRKIKRKPFCQTFLFYSINKVGHCWKLKYNLCC